MKSRETEENDTFFESAALVASLRTCAKNKNLSRGASVHADAFKRGLLGKNPFVTSAVVSMYAKCGAFEKAKEVLGALPTPNVVFWNALIAGYVQGEQPQEALNCFEQMQQYGLSPDAVTFICALKACSILRVLEKGKDIHNEIARQGLVLKKSALGNSLVDMYVKCGAFMIAKEVLEELPVRDVVSWSALITGFVEAQLIKESLAFFEQMQFEGVLPNRVTYISILKACGSIGALEKGEYIHSEVVRQGLLGGHALLGGALVDMYVKCGSISKAKAVLEGLPVRDLVSWSALISGYAHLEHGMDALNCFERMQCEGIFPDAVTFACVLKACGSIGALEKGKVIHSEIAKSGLLSKNVILGNTLVDMYAKCGAVDKAKEMLDGLAVRDAVSWNALIAGYVQREHGKEALNCYQWMNQDAVLPNSVTFVCLLKACGSIGALDIGENLHSEIVRQGLLLGDSFALGGALVDMYTKCGALAKAKELLEGYCVRNVVSWNTLISGYAQRDHGEEALECFEQMKCEGLLPDATTFTCLLKACGCIKALDKGEIIHTEIVKMHLLHGNIVLGNTLVDMYAKCGALPKAKEVFDGLSEWDVVSWSVLISGYAQGEHGKEALACFEKMQGEGLLPDVVTYVSILKACGTIGVLANGEYVHSEIVRQGLDNGNVILGNVLVDMYAKCAALPKAKEVLEWLPVRDVVSWNTLIAGYTQEEFSREALECFESMKCEGLFPDAVTFACILKACGTMGAVDRGNNIHIELIKQGLLGENVVVGNALVDLYSKCGALTKAREVLEGLPVRDVVSWNSLIAGYAQEEHGEEALDCFERILHEGLFPDQVTFLCVLTACSHSGLLEEGAKYFTKMNTDYGMMAKLEHSTSMVHLFGRAGLFDKAIKFIKKVSCFSDRPVWRALLSACTKWGNVKIGKWAFEKVQSNGASCMSTSSFYVDSCSKEEPCKLQPLEVGERHSGSRPKTISVS